MFDARIRKNENVHAYFKRLDDYEQIKFLREYQEKKDKRKKKNRGSHYV